MRERRQAVDANDDRDARGRRRQEVSFTLRGRDLAATDGADRHRSFRLPHHGGTVFWVWRHGDARPDVAATYGAQFERAAYSPTVDQLPPGTYHVVVYPHRAATGTFEGAQVVRVTLR